MTKLVARVVWRGDQIRVVEFISMSAIEPSGSEILVGLVRLDAVKSVRAIWIRPV